MSKTNNTKKPLDRIHLLERLRRKIQSPNAGLKEISVKSSDHPVRSSGPGRGENESPAKEGKGGPGPAGQGDFSFPPDQKKRFGFFGKK
ncbi:MAG: hypothetical protein H6562_09710 [Lewinellaceae bacterium]|nr:hypothetical protein [Lewinella sp.]MCB9279179.1 hypothetical protein [Lewinellaceae bacterium]